MGSSIQRVYSQTIFIGIIFSCILAGLTLPISGSYADTVSTTPTPSPTASTDQNTLLGQFSTICQATLSAGSTASSDPNATQKLQYCRSAQSSKDAAATQQTLWKVWAGVAGICAAACMASFAGITNQYVCIGLNTAAGITDAVMAHDFMNALMQISAGGLGYMINGMTNTSAKQTANPETGVEKEPTEKDIGACFIAASAAYQVYNSHSTMQSSLSSEANSLASAQSLNSAAAAAAAAATAAASSNVPAPTSTSSTGQSGGTRSNILAANGINPVNSGSSNGCTSANPATGVMISCALAANSNLPPFVGNPQFLSDFHKAAGMNFGEFAQQNNSPGKALSTAMGGSLNANQTTQLNAAIQAFEEKLPAEITRSTYSGGAKGGSAGSDSSIDHFMESFLGKINPQKEDKNPSGLHSVDFTKQNPIFTDISEDKSLNIFHRISNRYRSMGNSLLEKEETHL